jgi:hypothetical protein
MTMICQTMCYESGVGIPNFSCGEKSLAFATSFVDGVIPWMGRNNSTFIVLTAHYSILVYMICNWDWDPQKIRYHGLGPATRYWRLTTTRSQTTENIPLTSPEPHVPEAWLYPRKAQWELHVSACKVNLTANLVGIFPDSRYYSYKHTTCVFFDSDWS